MRIEDHMDGILYQYRPIRLVVLNFQEIHLAIQGINQNYNIFLITDIQAHPYGQIERLD